MCAYILHVRFCTIFICDLSYPVPSYSANSIPLNAMLCCESEVVREQITRVLLERLIVHRQRPQSLIVAACQSAALRSIFPTHHSWRTILCCHGYVVVLNVRIACPR